MIQSKFDIIIIGGGIVGTAIARELSKYRLKTCLIEKESEVSFGVSKANSGIIHAGFHASAATVMGQLCARGNFLYGELQKELDIPFKRVGELVVIHHDEDFASLQEFRRQGEENGVPDLQILDKKGVHELEPNLAEDIVGALYAPSAGVVNPYETVYILENNARKNGVRFKTGEEVIAINGCERSLVTTKGEYSYQYVINAAGLAGDRIANMVGLRDFVILPRKGQEYLLDRKCQDLIKHIIFPLPTHNSKGTLIIPTLDGTIMVGPSAEDGLAPDDLSTSNEVFEFIFNQARKMVPTIDSKHLISAFAGMRPVASTGDFIIGTTKVPGFINVAGIQSPGLTSAPAIAERMVEILKAEGLKLEKKYIFISTNSKIHKVREASHEELQKLIEVNPDYGSMTCRCEMVSEAEIKQAIRGGASTMDGIKFRTRAGMGRCQGGFCSYRVIELLADGLGISPLNVTKKGPGSELLIENIGNPDE